MRIVSWNLAGGNKREPVEGIEADIALFQERRRADAHQHELWSGKLHFKGLSVRSHGLYSLEAMRCPGELPRYFVPMQVSGLERFQLIGVWAQNDDPDRYVRGIVRAVSLCRDQILAQPTVIAGDFNANACWNDEHPADRNFSALARQLDGLGLVSAYHQFSGEAFGEETRPTFYLHRFPHRPYHIDYCFIPKSWLPRLRSVTVGTYSEWTKWSDHVPVTVELDDPIG